jgi:two-component system, response regulator PdtaR
MAAAVLIVEDQMLIAWHIRDLVEQAGHEVVAMARNPAEAVAAAAQHKPDFAMMDIRLESGASGLEAARMLYEGWGVRSLYVSANLDGQTREQAEEFRPLGFIGKPFLAAQVLDAIAAAVREIGKVGGEVERVSS